MKIFLYILAAVGVVGITIGVCYVLFKRPDAHAPQNPETTFPISSTFNQPKPEPATAAGVSAAFSEQIAENQSITLSQVRVVAPYALQDWSDENKGGQALLKYESGTWKLLTLGGGAWDTESLVAVGVPSAIATQLLQ